MIEAIQKELRDAAGRLYDIKVAALRDKLADATPKKTGHAAAGWKVVGNTIVNDVSYISELNHGSSQQAPSFFVERTVIETAGLKPKGTIVNYR